MDQDIIQTIEQIKYNAEASHDLALEIIAGSSDYFAKHKASDMKAKAEDTLKLVGALNELIKMEE